ncbi:MAG: S8 family serine peptidase [Flavobacteriaceae bacterium]|nr:S8 family serine peptidase [Flavobacteriaceae bacterium]
MKKITFFSKGRTFTLVFLVSLVFGFSHAQDAYTIQYQDEVLTVEENIQSFQWDQMPESSQLDNGYFGWVQFYETPTQDIQDAFRANRMELIDYIPHRTYLFYFPQNTSIDFLRNSGVRAIVPVEGRFKMAQNLKNGNIEDWAKQGDHLLVTLVHHQNMNTEDVVTELGTHQIIVRQSYPANQTLELTIPNNCLEQLADLPFVKWIELIPPPSIKEDIRGRSIHRSNGLDTQGAGRNYTGVGVGVLVRDDGIIGPHIDFHGRIDNSFATGTGQTHGDGVAGILTGAGNIDPTKRGMAAGADLFVSNYGSNFLDTATTTLIGNGSVQITNSSYGNGCNDGYTTTARNVDEQVYDNENLIHIFSAGNSGTQNCGYGAGSGWGNITGGHKQGKNVIATANVRFNGALETSSSRGPAQDGRIKPDITAHGQGQLSTNENNGYLTFGGTSGAAPGIAGVSAQLYEVYADFNGGTLPPSGLVKAAILNTANDYGNEGPDFKFGWGLINGLRAGILIEDGRYLTDEVSQGNQNTHNISVPAGTTQVRFMLYWTDPEASPGANPALVNDLDLVVTDPSNNDLLPWVLDHTPNPTNLDAPATNGVDHLNNMEQVLINAPAAGNYTLEISGFNVPQGPQEYFVVYEIISDELTLTYPNGDENFVPGQAEVIHWDAVNTTDGFDLEYSTDNGGSWNTIGSIGGGATNFSWVVPSDITGAARVRITSGSFQDESDNVFSIAELVTNITVDQVCLTDATFSWDAVPNAESYDFYLLGSQYMEVVGTSNTNSITVPIPDADAELWYSVVAKNDTDGWEGRRANAQFYNEGLFDCLLVDDLDLQTINNTGADFSTACGDADGIVSVTIYNNGTNPQTNFTISYQLSGSPSVDEVFTGTLGSQETLDYDFTTPLVVSTNGSYSLTTTVTAAIDQYATNNSEVLSFNAQTDPTGTPYEQSFEGSGVPPLNWEVTNPDDGITWQERSNIVGSGTSLTTAAYFNNYDYNEPGEEDWLTTEIFDLNGLANPGMTFDLAKAQFSSDLSDALRVEISADCGSTFTTVYEKDGLELSTLASYNTEDQWSPSIPPDWRNEFIDLSAYQDQIIIIRFININGYGNSTYIDNLNVGSDLLGVNDIANFKVAISPNPASHAFSISIPNGVDAQTKVQLVNSLGQQVQSFDATIFNGNEATIDVTGFAAGLYFVQIQNGNQNTTQKLLVE